MNQSSGRRRLRIRIRGKVQGVRYRASAAEEAQRLGVVGWVQNLPDGSVEATAEGTPAAVEAFVRWAHRGPSAARVTDVSVDNEPATFAEQSFLVLR